MGQLTINEPIPPAQPEHGFQGSGHLLHATFPSQCLWVTADLRLRLNHIFRVLFGKLLGQHRLIGLHGFPDDRVLEAGGNPARAQDDLVPGPDLTQLSLHHATSRTPCTANVPLPSCGGGGVDHGYDLLQLQEKGKLEVQLTLLDLQEGELDLDLQARELNLHLTLLQPKKVASRVYSRL